MYWTNNRSRRSGAVDVHLYDIARVEALAGPQGTLYGASSEAGTIRIITNKPDPSGFDAGYDLRSAGRSTLPRRP
jgi:outer membrane receptor protein involved in Fe transport